MSDETRHWVRMTDERTWYWRSTLAFLVSQQDRAEPLEGLFRTHLHAWKDGSRLALDHLDYLIEIEELGAETTVQEAIAQLKRLRRQRFL